jgi:ribulose-phosphate 3-epimerase
VTWHEWKRGAEIEPSLYAANFAILGEQIETLCGAGCRIFHFDIGDGHFVAPVTMGPIVLQSISPIVHRNGGAVDVHLMVENPAKYFAPVAAAGGDSVTFHYEAVADVPATIRSAREQQLQAGIAFNPESDPTDVARVSGGADLVLCMGIHPGYSGQPFREETIARVAALRSALPEQVLIQVDGGVDAGNVRRLVDEGVGLLVAGSSIFGRDDVAAAYTDLVRAVA